MEANKLYRGRLIDHIQLVVRDLAASRRFYEAALGALGLEVNAGGDDWFVCDELCISTADSVAAQGKLTGRVHLAFQCKDSAMVDAFHAAAVKAGGKDLGAPGLRDQYHPGYYAGFVADPDGNNIEAVYHGPATRSAESIEIDF